MNELEKQIDTLKKTYKHIELVKKLLSSCQIELMKRQFTHDVSKLEDPEFSMFVNTMYRLDTVEYGTPEYTQMIQEMLTIALNHHYEHNRHHPEFFNTNEPDLQINSHLTLINWAKSNACIMPDDIYGWENLEQYLKYAQNENVSSINNMNLFDVLEMFIDWYAACLLYKNGDINKSIEINKKRFSMSNQLTNIFKNTVPWVKNEFVDVKYQSDLKPLY